MTNWRNLSPWGPASLCPASALCGGRLSGWISCLGLKATSRYTPPKLSLHDLPRLPQKHRDAQCWPLPSWGSICPSSLHTFAEVFFGSPPSPAGWELPLEPQVERAERNWSQHPSPGVTRSLRWEWALDMLEVWLGVWTEQSREEEPGIGVRTLWVQFRLCASP